MPRDTYSVLQTKIEKEIAKLQKQANALRNKRRIPVIASIVRSMREYQIAPEEITAALSKKSAKSGTKLNGSSATAKRPVPVKYRHPETGATWTGRGKAPRWIVQAESDGKQRSDFLVQGK
ncbi:MAG: H-NS histone family protein [Candidimonas sp.]|nr:MAG: H-NS histone family protein [Candidimonas sp.]